MTSHAAVEASAVDEPAKAAKPAARKQTAAPKATPRTRKTAPKPPPVEQTEPVEQAEVIEVVEMAEVVETSRAPLPALAVRAPRRNLRAIAGFGLVLAVVATVAMLVVDRSADAPAQEAAGAVVVSAEELASFAGSQGASIYWAGPIRGRILELTRTNTGTFVRYLPAGIAVGGSSRALTIATYPLPDAYGTAAGRAKKAEMTSTRTANGGLAVWSKKQPTSVYVAFRGVPSLIEVYAPQANEARTLALSGRLRPVR